MSQYMLAVYSTDEPREPMTDEEMQRGFAVVHEIEEEMHAANALVYSGRLLEPARAKVVRPRRRGARPPTVHSPRRRSSSAASTSSKRPTSIRRSRGPRR